MSQKTLCDYGDKSLSNFIQHKSFDANVLVLFNTNTNYNVCTTALSASFRIMTEGIG